MLYIHVLFLISINIFNVACSPIGTTVKDKKVIKIIGETSDEPYKPWTEENLCVLKMGTSCPVGFKEDRLKLSVQTDVNPKDVDISGDRLIMLGQAGETSLTRNAYDAVYTFTIVTCCK